MSEPEKPDPLDCLKHEPIRIGAAELTEREISPTPGEGTEGRDILAQGNSTTG